MTDTESKRSADNDHSTHHELQEKGSVHQNATSVAHLPRAELNRILRKVDIRVIPILAILYLLSFLDRGKSRPRSVSQRDRYLTMFSGNIGNAKIQGLDTDLGLVDQQYNW